MPNVPRPRPPVAGSAGPDAAAAARVASWQAHTLRANVAFEAGRDVEARRFHEEALAVADAMLQASLETDRDAARYAPLLFGNSCNNIVELARRQEDVQTEGIFLYRAVERFIAVARSGRAPLRLRARCLLHLRVASESLYRYFERSGMWDAAASYTERANAAVFEVRRLEADARHRARASSSAVRGALAVGAPAGTRIEVIGVSPRGAQRAQSDGADVHHVTADGPLVEAWPMASSRPQTV
jgi:hypothetical protein